MLKLVKQLENPICVYDFTLFDGEDEKPVITLLEKFCKKWSFQLEEAPSTGSKHFQGRFSLKVKARLHLPFDAKFGKMKLSPTSKDNRDNCFYVTKEESRLAGPWADTDEKIYIPRDIRCIEKLWEWQESVIEILKTYDPRRVHVIYCPAGNTGKSTLVRWCMCYKIARKLPFVNDFKDIMRMVMDMPTATGYMMDMPRAVNKERLFQLYAGIEEVKGGYAYDDRYHFKEKIFDPPAIVLFSNSLPDEKLLSRDRWCIWTIADKKLVKYEPQDVDDLKEYLGGF